MLRGMVGCVWYDRVLYDEKFGDVTKGWICSTKFMIGLTCLPVHPESHGPQGSPRAASWR